MNTKEMFDAFCRVIDDMTTEELLNSLERAREHCKDAHLLDEEMEADS